jgi:hypothetical protein
MKSALCWFHYTDIFNMFDGYVKKYSEIVVYPKTVYGGQW